MKFIPGDIVRRSLNLTWLEKQAVKFLISRFKSNIDIDKINHFGIWTGNNFIHLTLKGVIESSEAEFAENKLLHYDEFYTNQIKNREEVISRAKSAIGKSDYHLHQHNCEAFVHQCVTDTKFVGTQIYNYVVIEPFLAGFSNIINFILTNKCLSSKEKENRRLYIKNLIDDCYNFLSIHPDFNILEMNKLKKYLISVFDAL